MNDKLQEKLKQLPLSPGVYFHKSISGEIIYVGKAAVLKNRVRQYFQNSRSRDNKTMALVAEIDDTDWTETESEVDALFLESEMVKRYMPRYNILLRDDKSQSYVRIDMKSEWPTLTMTRNPLDDGAEYIGPFYNGLAVKRALRYLRRIFPYLTRERRTGQSQLDEHLGISPRLSDGSEAYKADLRLLMQYIRGRRTDIARELEREMKYAAKAEDFEKAAKIRNKLTALSELRRRVMFGDSEFTDISKDRALSDLTDLLGLNSEPVRIECFDISHLSGTGVVASMVAFVNGVSARSEYRKFKLSREINDDTANMSEIVTRRFSQKNQKSWGVPDLVLIDGGKPQLGAALEAARAQGYNGPIISIAKRNDEIVVHSTKSNVTIDSSRLSPGLGVVREGDYLFINLHPGAVKSSGHAMNLRSSGSASMHDDVVRLIQRIRDESHRFAISYHQVIRSSRQNSSLLDGIAGIGPKSRSLLLKKFGSLKQIMAASESDISDVVGPAKAKLIIAQLHSEKSNDIII